jgi:hypothetical protein
MRGATSGRPIGPLCGAPIPTPMTDTHHTTLSKTTSQVLPDALCALFDGTRLEALTGEAFSLLTVDEAGRPHTSLLSLGELWAPDAGSMRIALWPSARAASHLARMPRAALTGVSGGAFFQVQLTQVQALGMAEGLRCFTAQIERVETQRVAYAQLTSGITFVLQGDAIKARWRAQLAALKSLG